MVSKVGFGLRRLVAGFSSNSSRKLLFPPIYKLPFHQAGVPNTEPITLVSS